MVTSEVTKELGKVCAEARHASGISPETLATMVVPVVQGNTLRRFEKGQNQPGRLDSILDAYVQVTPFASRRELWEEAMSRLSEYNEASEPDASVSAPVGLTAAEEREADEALFRITTAESDLIKWFRIVDGAGATSPGVEQMFSAALSCIEGLRAAVHPDPA